MRDKKTTANKVYVPLWGFRVIRSLCFKTTFGHGGQFGAGRQSHSLWSFILAPIPTTSHTRTLWPMPGQDFTRHMKLIFILTILTTLTGCENQLKFDSRKWKEYRDIESYPNRQLMLRDIVENKRFIGLSYKSIIDSLGQPENYVDNETNELWYLVTTDYGTDIDPVYTKHLVLTIDNDSTVTTVNIKEWNK